jgi:hypothetical protein
MGYIILIIAAIILLVVIIRVNDKKKLAKKVDWSGSEGMDDLIPDWTALMNLLDMNLYLKSKYSRTYHKSFKNERDHSYGNHKKESEFFISITAESEKFFAIKGELIYDSKKFTSPKHYFKVPPETEESRQNLYYSSLGDDLLHIMEYRLKMDDPSSALQIYLTIIWELSHDAGIGPCGMDYHQFNNKHPFFSSCINCLAIARVRFEGQHWQERDYMISKELEEAEVERK